MLLSACVLLAGCSAIPSHKLSPFGDGDAPTRLLHYANRVADFGDSQVRDQVQAARRRFSHNPTAYNRIKLALLLMASVTPVTDYAEAESLLSNYVSQMEPSAGSQALAPLARYLLSTVRTRQKLVQAFLHERKKRRQLQDELKRIKAVVGGARPVPEKP